MGNFSQELEMKFRELRFGLQDAMDRPNESLARKIMNDIQKCEDMAQSNKTLRSIEKDMHAIMNDLKQSQSAPANQHVISPTDSNKFYRKFEQLRNEIRKQPNY